MGLGTGEAFQIVVCGWLRSFIPEQLVIVVGDEVRDQGGAVEM